MISLQNEIRVQLSPLPVEVKEAFKESFYPLIVEQLEKQFLTTEVYTDEAFEKRFKGSTRQQVFTNNIHYVRVNSNLVDWYQTYGDVCEELLHAYNLKTPAELQYIYTVERKQQNYDIQYQLQFCSPSYEDSLPELKRASETPFEGMAILIGWYKGEPKVVQWAEDGEVSELKPFTDENNCSTGLNRFYRY